MQNVLIRGIIYLRTNENYIYIAVLGRQGWAFKVADYLIQAQDRRCYKCGYITTTAWYTRGAGDALFYSFFILITALTKLIRGRYTGRLAGVHHVNMAERLSTFLEKEML
jgi:hypothetical protein